MLEALARIERYSHDMGVEDFVSDDRSVDAVVRNLEIIGEAAHRVPIEVQQRHPEIPWSHLTEIRHILVHEYHSVDSALIWATVRNDIPDVSTPLRALLREEDE
jgi:uncharacterized protein with HEPN domain